MENWWEDQVEAKKRLRTSGMNLQYIPETERTNEFCTIAVKSTGYAIQYVPKKTKPLWELALKRTPYAIKFHKTQPEDLCFLACNNDPRAIKLIRNPSEDLCYEVITMMDWHTLNKIVNDKNFNSPVFTKCVDDYATQEALFNKSSKVELSPVKKIIRETFDKKAKEKEKALQDREQYKLAKTAKTEKPIKGVNTLTDVKQKENIKKGDFKSFSDFTYKQLYDILGLISDNITSINKVKDTLTEDILETNKILNKQIEYTDNLEDELDTQGTLISKLVADSHDLIQANKDKLNNLASEYNLLAVIVLIIQIYTIYHIAWGS